MTGRTYLLGGQHVTVVCAFVLPSKRRPLPTAPDWLTWVTPPPGAPRNVAIRYPEGHVVVRPFRGLRKPPVETLTPTLFDLDGVAP
ncbi:MULTISPECIES: hypothetical protein [unclassified Nonomuraea]|uniref:hypothetical protein n=1 Tax=unclassified Nonomuraea TaxID=2593643 RepID=UPI0033F0EBC6